jgi:hypothetical protein
MVEVEMSTYAIKFNNSNSTEVEYVEASGYSIFENVVQFFRDANGQGMTIKAFSLFNLVSIEPISRDEYLKRIGRR